MGTSYNICFCKHEEDAQNEENDLSYKNQSNKDIFLNNNLNLNQSEINNNNNINYISKDTIEFNNQVNALANNYKNDIPKKILNEKLKNDFMLKKNKTPKNQNNLIIKCFDDSDTKQNYFSYFNNNTNLKNVRSLLSKEYKYIGEKSPNNLKEGFGICIWNNQTKYIGYFKNNKADGYGKFIDENIKYKGQFKNDVASGYGIYSKGDELLYQGYWLNDLQDNYGWETWIDNSEYSGQYKEGKKHGIGVYNWEDGTKYEGFWNKNVREGYGIMYYTKKKIYIGEWKNNEKEGFGELITSDKKYVGFFSKDKKEGFGIIYLNKINKAYMGFWQKGKQFGFGKIMTRNKKKYGIWLENSQVNWFKNEEESFKFLETNGLKAYKSFFIFTLDDIRNYCINNDEFNSLLD